MRIVTIKKKTLNINCFWKPSWWELRVNWHKCWKTLEFGPFQLELEG